MIDVSEWVVWEAPSGVVELVDGRKITVCGGDEVLIEERPGGVVFLDHRSATRH